MQVLLQSPRTLGRPSVRPWKNQYLKKYLSHKDFSNHNRSTLEKEQKGIVKTKPYLNQKNQQVKEKGLNEIRKHFEINQNKSLNIPKHEM